MPTQVVFALIIESALVGLTALLLLQPEGLFRGHSPALRAAVRGGGLVLLCLTFCWSVIFGAVMALNHMTIQL
jgi:hypothetical protein